MRREKMKMKKVYGNALCWACFWLWKSFCLMCRRTIILIPIISMNILRNIIKMKFKQGKRKTFNRIRQVAKWIANIRFDSYPRVICKKRLAEKQEV